MTIEHQQSLFWGLFHLKKETVSTGFVSRFERTGHDIDGVGRWHYFEVEVTSPDSLRVLDTRNQQRSTYEETYAGREINEAGVCMPPSCVGVMIGYQDRFRWVPTEQVEPTGDLQPS